jgi:hypothetical protein
MAQRMAEQRAAAEFFDQLRPARGACHRRDRHQRCDLPWMAHAPLQRVLRRDGLNRANAVRTVSWRLGPWDRAPEETPADGGALHPTPQTVAGLRPTPALERSSRRQAAMHRSATAILYAIDCELVRINWRGRRLRRC